MKTIRNVYYANPDKYASYLDFVGHKVKKLVTRLEYGKETWSEEEHLITAFNDNICGDGCCQGFELNGESMYSYWPDDLLLAE